MELFLYLFINLILVISMGCASHKVADPAVPEIRIAKKSTQHYSYSQSLISETDNDTEKYVVCRIAIKPFDDPYIPSSPYNSYVEVISEQDNETSGNVRTITKRPTQPEQQFDPSVVTAAITDALLKTQRFEVVERPDINSVLREIEFNESKWVIKEPSNKHLLYPVDLLLSAAVSNNSEKVNTQNTVFFRLYSVKTGTVLHSARGTGNSLLEAIESGIQDLSTQIYSTPWSCEVIEVNGTKLNLNAGSADGLRPGDRFFCIQPGLRYPGAAIIRQTIRISRPYRDNQDNRFRLC